MSRLQVSPRHSATNYRGKYSVESILNSDLSSLCFYAAYIAWLAFGILNASMFAQYINGTPYNTVRVMCYALLLFSLLLESRQRIRSLPSVAIVLVLAVSAVQFDRLVILDTVAFVFCGRYRNFDTIMRLTIGIVSTLVALVVISSQLGIIPDYLIGSVGNRLRHYLGFRYTLRGPQLILLVTLLVVAMRRGRLFLWDAVILLAANAFFYYYTDSRTIFILSLMAILGCSVFATFTQRAALSAGGGYLFIASFVVFAIVSIAVTALYDPTIPWMYTLNSSDLLAGRLSMGKYAMDTYGVTLLGQPIEFIGRGLDLYGQRYAGTFFYLDSLYVRMLINYGVALLLVYIIGMSIACAEAWRNRQWWIVFIIGLLAVHCVMDDLSMYLTYNTFLFLIGMIGISSAGKTTASSNGTNRG